MPNEGRFCSRILCLPKHTLALKPERIVKTIPRTSKLIVVAASLGMVAVLAFQACVIMPPWASKRQFGLEINKPFRLVDLNAFRRAVESLSESAYAEFRIVFDDGKTEDLLRGSKLSIKTDKVTMFDVPKTSSAEELTAIGSNITHRVYSNNVNDIQKILDELKKQQP